MDKLKGSETYVAAARLGMQVCAGHGFSTESVMSFRYREPIVATISGGTSQIQRNGIARSMGREPTEAASVAGFAAAELKFSLTPNEPGFPSMAPDQPSLQEREHAFHEELTLGRIEVELVLVTQQRLVGGGEEEGLWLDPLRAELLGEKLRERPERIAVSHRDKCRGKCGRDVVSH